MDDIRAVLDAAGSEHATLFGVSEGTALCALFGATYPQRTDALVLYGSYARETWAADYPWSTTTEEWPLVKDIEESWGTTDLVDILIPGSGSERRRRTTSSVNGSRPPCVWVRARGRQPLCRG